MVESRVYQRSARPLRRGPLQRVELHVEVPGPQHPKVEAFVLDLVTAEILALGGGGEEERGA